MSMLVSGEGRLGLFPQDAYDLVHVSGAPADKYWITRIKQTIAAAWSLRI